MAYDLYAHSETSRSGKGFIENPHKVSLANAWHVPEHISSHYALVQWKGEERPTRSVGRTSWGHIQQDPGMGVLGRER